MNNVKNSIGWADYTWNPVVGCKRKCHYCYAKRIHDRFHPDKKFTDIVFYPKRLKEAEKLIGDEKVFVGSMSDIEYWHKEWTQQIIDTCKMAAGTTFMFLSKNPYSYDGFVWPKNTMQGLTITHLGCLDAITLVLMFDFPRPFLSIEPLLGNISGNLKNTPFETIIVGAMTGPKAVIPKPEWIQSIKDNVPAEKIYWKNNIKKYL
jgi:protein gp37